MKQERAKRILVVEDDDSLRELLCRGLTRFGFETIRASNGEEAFQLFSEATQSQEESARLDAAVTDFFMPRKDGADLIRKIKAVRPEFPVVLVTGEAPDAVILELAAFADVMTILKPFRPEALRQGLQNVLHEPLPDGRTEHRKSIRVDVAVSCTFCEGHGKSGEFYYGSVRNLNFGGCYIQFEKGQFEEILPAGSLIRFAFQGLEHYDLAGRVVWSRESGMGIALQAEKAESHTFFKKFVLNKLKQKGVGIMGSESVESLSSATEVGRVSPE
jgi:CheY-like chemotaxis protein